jgi:hypothetical protein
MNNSNRLTLKELSRKLGMVKPNGRHIHRLANLRALVSAAIETDTNDERAERIIDRVGFECNKFGITFESKVGAIIRLFSSD